MQKIMRFSFYLQRIIVNATIFLQILAHTYETSSILRVKISWNVV